MRKQTMLTLVLLGAIGAQVSVAAGRAGGGAVTTPLTPVETADLRFMREEEKLARDVYLQSYDQWATPSFANIASSEQSHMDAMLRLLRRYQLADPAAGAAIGEFQDPSLQALHDNLMALGSTSELAALKVGGFIEEVDMRDIVAAMDRSQHADIDQTYAQLLCGSRNHLRAYAAQVSLVSGTAYVAQMLNQSAVDAIVHTATERCGP
ncbi:MAG: DUF2202 domain-containing protein [Rhodanobacteraceae bacterium]|nr:DUF2202 domain-containing protein [Rhodanobacteraceae bacterium]